MNNLVIIMADQLRYDFAGAETEHIDRIKAEGTEFVNAYCACPLCIPTRGSFFTGMYPNETGCTINAFGTEDKEYGYVKRGIPNLYEWLEPFYDVWHVGKNHFWTEEAIEKKKSSIHWTYMQPDYKAYLSSHNKEVPGGDAYKGLVPQMYGDCITHLERFSSPETGVYPEGFQYYYDGYFLNGAIEAIRNRDKTKPLFLSAMFLAPHPPLQIPEPWFSMYEEDTAALTENVGRWCRDQSPLQLYNLPGVIGVRYGREKWKQIWRVYKGAVSMLDYCVGRLVEELKREGLYDDTVLLFTSDHGEMLGSHGLWQKMCMYQEAVKTPLYIKCPESYNVSVHEYVSTIDVFPTLCDLLEVPIPPTVTGTSLKGLMEGKTEEREPVFIQFDGNGGIGNTQRCVIYDGKKLIVDLFKNETYLELYDIERDLQERENLIFNPAFHDLAEAYLTKLDGHMRKTGDRICLSEHTLNQFLTDYEHRRLHGDVEIK